MSKRSFASRVQPRGEWLLVRKPEQAASSPKVPKLAVAERKEGGGFDVVEGGPSKRNQGIVVAVGPGEWKEGTFVKPTSEVGQLIVFADKGSFQVPDFPEMKEEGLFFVPDSLVICALTEARNERSVISA